MMKYMPAMLLILGLTLSFVALSLSQKARDDIKRSGQTQNMLLASDSITEPKLPVPLVPNFSVNEKRYQGAVLELPGSLQKQGLFHGPYTCWFDMGTHQPLGFICLRLCDHPLSRIDALSLAQAARVRLLAIRRHYFSGDDVSKCFVQVMSTPVPSYDASSSYEEAFAGRTGIYWFDDRQKPHRIG